MDAHPIPDHIYLSEQIKVCLEEGEFEMTQNADFLKYFDISLYTMDLSVWPKAIRLENSPVRVLLFYFTTFRSFTQK